MKNKAWIISASMGYGHQRTAYPLREIAYEGKIINVNDYDGIPLKDKNFWDSNRRFYEFISDFKKIPVIGEPLFGAFDAFQQIPAFYPRRDLSKPTFSLRKNYSFIKKGWGQDLISKLKKNPLPIVASFFTPAFMAEEFKYPEDIYCVICDADISRTWAPLNPQKSRIKYFAPNNWVIDRLKQYGVKEKNIYLTGYPLPLENIGTRNKETAKEDFKIRLLNLDPTRWYTKQYRALVENEVGKVSGKSLRPLTLLFSIGGAGAQKEIVISFLKGLKEKIKDKEIKVILSAGTRPDVIAYFLRRIENIGLKRNVNKNIEIIYEQSVDAFFAKFNKKLKETDILWTKPSELSFYAGLGIPIIIAPSVGAQEDLNKKWLLRMGA
ncbi:MAG: hypothetical protein NTW46_01010, partial [Candidatus Nealsonbacteria bacterium]|nr:hypothetical protein [Candidatus Nealsonbacteria bacterium]